MADKQTKLHKIQDYYTKYQKGQINSLQFKTQLQSDLKIRWNPSLENVIHQVDPSYTDLMRSINKTNKYVPKQSNNNQPLNEQINYPKKIRTEHIGHTDLLKWN